MNEVNKIFGRDFILAFFVPSLAFIAATVGLLNAFSMQPEWLRIDPAAPLKDTTFLALIILVASFSLMALNRPVFRLLEGYWLFNLGSRLNFIQRWRFRKIHARLRVLRAERDQCEKENREFTQVAELTRLMLRAAQRFPSKESLVLFTSFGNTVRAFEDYPRVMYGFESINGWSRLNAVMPKEYHEALDSMRAMTDLWVSIWFLSLVFMAEYLSIIMWTSRRFQFAWILGVSVIVAFLASWQARIAAEQWGEWVKAAFDVFLPALCGKLGYKQPDKAQAEREFWHILSQAIVYRHAPSLDKLEPLRENPCVFHDKVATDSTTKLHPRTGA